MHFGDDNEGLLNKDASPLWKMREWVDQMIISNEFFRMEDVTPYRVGLLRDRPNPFA